MTLPKPQYFDLSHFALLEISGDDAYTFLQGQIAGDLGLLNTAPWLFSGWCLPNGRVICTFIAFRQDHSLMLILPSMLRDKITKRLSMFVLRSKVTIKDVSDDYALTGLHGIDVNTVIPAAVLENITVLKFSGHSPRCILISRMDHVSDVLNAATEKCTAGERAGWSLLDIESGLPWILNATTEAFLPQMLNLDDMQGLSYQKGCYPGQEVIARLHYRGQLKKKLYLGTTTGQVLPGTGDRIDNQDTGEYVGDVIDAEHGADDHIHLLAVLETRHADNPALRIPGLQDAPVTFQSLHYSS